MMETKPRVKWMAENGWVTFRENGPQRAQRRAAKHGLTIGASVAAQCRGWWGVGDPPPNATPRSERTYAGPGGAVPLDFAQRLERYAGQSCARQGGVFPGWRPTARQARRMRHKANHAAAPFGRRVPGSYLNERVAAVPVATPDAPVPTTGLYRVEPSRGFKLTDRRGEHRA